MAGPALSRWGLGWGLLLVVAGHGMPVLTVWQRSATRVVLVSPETTLGATWAKDLLAGVPVRHVSPGSGATALELRRGESVRLVLYSHDQAALWPDEVVARLGRDPRLLPPAEVLVSYRPCGQDPGKPPWEFLVGAPTADQLQSALAELLQTDAGRCLTEPDSLIGYRLQPCVAVGSNEADLQAWLRRQDQRRARLAVRCLAPQRLTPTDLPETGTLAVALTVKEWRSGLSEAARQALLPLLPANVAAFLTSAEGQRGDTRVVAGIARRDRDARTVAVVAPTARMLGDALAPGAASADHPPWLGRVGSLSLEPFDAEVLDLRACERVLLSATAADPAAEPWAAALGLRVRAALSQECGFRFIDDAVLQESLRRRALAGVPAQEGLGDDADPTIDALAVVRLVGLYPRVEYREAEPRCLATDPGRFDEAEPQEPHPDDRRYVIVGPKKYPRGADDPKYRAARREYDRQIAEWRRKRDDHERQRAEAQVTWVQSVVRTRTVRLEGQLALYGRGGRLLRSLQLAGATKDQQVEEVRTVVRGFGHPPPSLRLPPPSELVDEPLVQEALARAAEPTGRALRALALVPLDVDEADRRRVARTPSGQVVVVTGSSARQSSLEATREAARRDARRLAVGQVLGAYVSQNALAGASEAARDALLAQAEGFAEVRQELEESLSDNALALRCEVEVRPQPLRRHLVQLGLARQWRCMVVLPERAESAPTDATAAATALTGRLVEEGLPCIDRAQHADLLARQAELLAIQGKPELARRLRFTYGAEILVTGVADTQATAPQAGLETCRARLQILVVDLNTAEVLAADEQDVAAMDQTIDLARAAAAAKAARQISDRVVDRIFQRIGPQTERLQVTLHGFDRGIQPLARLEAGWRQQPVVDLFRRSEYQAGVARYEVDVLRGHSSDFAVRLEDAALDPDFRLVVRTNTTGTIQADVVWKDVEERARREREEAARRAAEARAQAVADAARAAAEAIESANAALRLELAERDLAAAAEAARREPVAIELPRQPVLVAGHLLVPAVPVVGWLGGETYWDEASHTLTAVTESTASTRTITLVVGSRAAFVDGRPRPLPVAPQVSDDVVLVPLRWLADAVGASVETSPAERLVRLRFDDRTGLLPLVLAGPGAR